MAAAVEDAVEIHRVGALPILVGDRLDVADQEDPGAVHHAVNAAEARAHVFDGGGPARIAGDVEPHEVQAGRLACGALTGGGASGIGLATARRALAPPLISTVFPRSRPCVIGAAFPERG